jgi:hypothetical protein
LIITAIPEPSSLSLICLAAISFMLRKTIKRLVR